MSKFEKRSKKCLSLSDKLDVIFFQERTKCSMRKLAKEFHIGKTQAGAIIRERDKYFELWKSDSTDERAYSKKFGPDSIGLMIDQYVYAWYTQNKNKKIPVTGSAMQKKALEAAKELGKDDFRASSGWLERFKKRHNIVLKSPAKNNKKSKTVISESLNDWETQLGTLLSNNSPDNIYCVYETGLFFQAVPEDVINLRYETCLCGKLSSQRFTLLLCASMAGTKEPPLIIAKEEIVSDSDSISEYAFESNPMAWMTCGIMTKWLKEMDKKMAVQKRKICLLLNISPAHKCPKLKNIKIIYFPSHLLGESQPMNHGIIQAFKIHYRLLILRHLIAQSEINNGEKTSTRTIDLSMGLSWIKLAWEGISKSLIERSYKNSGFDHSTTDISQSDNEPSLNEVAELLCAYDSDIHAFEYVNIDANLATEAEDTEHMEMLVDGIQVPVKLEDIKEEVMSFVEPAEKEILGKSYEEAMENLKFLEQFYLSQNDANGVLLTNKLMMHTKSLLDNEENNI